MSKLTGVFSKFKSLDKIPITDISSHVKSKGAVFSPEDFLGNRMTYPQTLAVTQGDLEMDFAILIEAVKRQPNIFFDVKTSSFMIPEEVLLRFPPIPKLIKCLASALDIHGLVSILVKNSTMHRAGCLLRLPSIEKKDYLELLINNQNVRVKAPSFSDIKVNDPQISIKVLGVNDSKVMNASGGLLGVLVDIYAK